MSRGTVAGQALCLFLKADRVSRRLDRLAFAVQEGEKASSQLGRWCAHLLPYNLSPFVENGRGTRMLCRFMSYLRSSCDYGRTLDVVMATKSGV
jgi:hypothetical protein